MLCFVMPARSARSVTRTPAVDMRRKTVLCVTRMSENPSSFSRPYSQVR